MPFNPIESKLKDYMEAQLKEWYAQGLSVGAKTTAHVTLEKLSNVKSDSKKEEMLSAIEEVRKFCKVSIGNKE